MQTSIGGGVSARILLGSADLNPSNFSLRMGSEAVLNFANHSSDDVKR